jgi:hypothetical protein
MKFIALAHTLTPLALIFAGCAVPMVADRDPFSGTYRFADSREKSYLVVSQVSEAKWNVQMSVDGGPLATHPHSQNSPMVLAEPEVLASAFAGPTPIAQVSCLASSGRYKVPFLCKVPVNVEYQVAQAMSPRPLPRSTTGYVLLVFTPAGAIAAELIRAP